MFNKAPDKMTPEPTPERVLAVCRMLARASMSRAELREAITLGQPSRSSYSEFNMALAVAQNDLGAAAEKDEKLTLAIDPSHVADPVSFRRFVSSRVFLRKDSSFVLFCRWYLDKNEAVLAMNWEDCYTRAVEEVSALRGLSENDMLGWRFWAAYLGLGYLSGTALLPNAKTRLQDLMATDYPRAFPYGEAVGAPDFINWLSLKMPEANLSAPLPLAVSAGLRTLHELGLISLEARMDTDKIGLYLVDGDLNNEFSHITVGEGVRG